jgi:hypothetical protein
LLAASTAAFAVAAGAGALLNNVYAKVWSGSGSKTIQGKVAATKHFNKFLSDVGIHTELMKWTVFTARDHLSIEFMSHLQPLDIEIVEIYIDNIPRCFA